MDNKKQYSRIGYTFALTKYIKGYALKFIATILVHMIYKVLPIAIGFIVSYMVGSAVLGDLRSVKLYFLVVLLLIISDALFQYLDVLVSHDMAYRILTDMRNLCYEKIDSLAPAIMEDKQSGDIISVVMEDVEILEWFYAHTIGQLLVSIIIPLTTLIILGNFSWKISLTLIPFILLLILIPVITKEKSNVQGSDLREGLGFLNAEIVDGIQGIRDIISFRWQRNYFNRFFNTTFKYNRASLDYAKRSANEARITTLIISIASILSKVVIVYLVFDGSIEKVWLLPLFILTSLVFDPIIETISMSRNYGMIFAAAKRVFDLLQMEPLVKDDGNLEAIDIIQESNMNDKIKVEFKNIQFTYPTRDINNKNLPILKDINFDVKTGETVALVGASGSGKTTIARLLQRFWDLDGGNIFINDVDIRKLSLYGLRDLVTVVPQDVYLFNMSILENLRLAEKDASLEEIKNACDFAQTLDYINKLPVGLNTIIGERGMRLSGGEKQRLSIAQAFLKNSPILVLDEASANLDSENERLINLAVSKLKEGRATIVIAHRISTIKNADRIVVIKEGKTLDNGTFDELIERNEYFKMLIGEEFNFSY